MDESSEDATITARDSTRPDPEGDVVFKCVDQDTKTTVSFRVSSKVLRLASPVFVGMLSPCFRAGQDLLHGGCPTIELQDDDASMMGLILDILHHQAVDDNRGMDAERLARLSIHCDKYDCIRALRPWVSVCFQNLTRTNQPVTEFGFKLLATYLFNDSEKFREISKMSLEQLIPDFSVEWEEEEMLALLPTSISSALTTRIKRTLSELEAELQHVELLLRQSPKCYETWQLFCVECGRVLPGVAKKCHPCHNSELPLRYCTSETRVAEYFSLLRKVELWPTATPFRTCAVSDITFRFTCTKADLKHNCTAGTYCPLLVNLELLVGRADRIKKKMNGLCLRCIREGNEWEENANCVHR